MSIENDFSFFCLVSFLFFLRASLVMLLRLACFVSISLSVRNSEKTVFFFRPFFSSVRGLENSRIDSNQERPGRKTGQREIRKSRVSFPLFLCLSLSSALEHPVHTPSGTFLLALPQSFAVGGRRHREKEKRGCRSEEDAEEEVECLRGRSDSSGNRSCTDIYRVYIHMYIHSYVLGERLALRPSLSPHVSLSGCLHR